MINVARQSYIKSAMSKVSYREKLLDYLIQAYETMNSIKFQHNEKNGDKQKRGKGEVFLSGLALMWHKRYIYINCEL